MATEEDKLWHLDAWAKLFKATTWEEMKMIAQDNSTIASTVKVIYDYNEDELIRRQCRAREEYERHERTVNKRIQDLTEALDQANTALAEKESALVEKESVLAEMNKKIQELEQQLNPQTKDE